MVDVSGIRAAVIGTGFIGTVHVHALRRLGVQITGVLGSSPDRGRARAAEIGVGKSYRSLEELLSDKSIDVVHVTSPNHAHYGQVKALIAAGKHVICEKPLAMTSAESAELADLAAASETVNAVCYNIRFYPLNHQAYGMVRAGELGDIRFVTGHYHQDWLAKPTDWNWRLEAEIGGALRSVADIGTHWVDLTSFVTGLKAQAVFADLSTFLQERQRPLGPVETFSSAAGATERVAINTDDASAIMIRYEGGAKAVMSTSQINVGQKNSLVWNIAGSKASAAWDSEKPDHLCIGRRDEPNQTMMRDFSLMNASGSAAASLPPGHVEGFADSFFAFFRAVYADIRSGERQSDSTWATFADGHFAMRFCDAVEMSASEGRWVELDEI
ncbi:MAG: Gfo/Idh/MocA family oxidoreductase [Pseudomonadota bacterium]